MVNPKTCVVMTHTCTDTCMHPCVSSNSYTLFMRVTSSERGVSHLHNEAHLHMQCVQTSQYQARTSCAAVGDNMLVRVASTIALNRVRRSDTVTVHSGQEIQYQWMCVLLNICMYPHLRRYTLHWIHTHSSHLTQPTVTTQAFTSHTNTQAGPVTLF